MSYIKDRIDEFEMEEAYSKSKGDIYCFRCKNFKIKGAEQSAPYFFIAP